jgi:hypothetical protein
MIARGRGGRRKKNRRDAEAQRREGAGDKWSSGAGDKMVDNGWRLISVEILAKRKAARPLVDTCLRYRPESAPLESTN